MLTKNHDIEKDTVREVVRTICTVTNGDLPNGFRLYVLKVENGETLCSGAGISPPIKISAWVMMKCTKLVEG